MTGRVETFSIGVALLVAVHPLTAQHSRPAGRHIGRDSDSTRLSRTDEDGQAATLPKLPVGMTIATLRAGDAVFHGRGGCVSCHGLDATGVPGKGSSLTAGLNYIPAPYSWSGLDSLERRGIAESITRTDIACPVRGVRGDLSDADVRRVAAYVWAIAQVRGEPWRGGHREHLDITRSTGVRPRRTP